MNKSFKLDVVNVLSGSMLICLVFLWLWLLGMLFVPSIQDYMINLLQEHLWDKPAVDGTKRTHYE